MEYFRQFIESLLYINEEVFWLKECLIAFKSLLIFLFFWWVISWNSRQVVLACLSTVIGITCIFLGDIGYLSDNDVLKLIAPISFYLLVRRKEQQEDLLLLLFLIPYFVTSYEFYRHFIALMESIGSHTLTIFCITLVKENKYLSLVVSTVIGILINYIGIQTPPGTNDIIMNPALITLIVKGLEFYTKNNNYTTFLKSFWATLLFFAFCGSWIFHFIKPICPWYLNY
ncbi:MAG: hypothetical protein E3K40_05980 [Candidatus Brocadia sp.]|nr:hypothetical protein [Candidatus Brocadia sp.]MDG6026255.1 hypothetical protein [Candidatus Brocadia sp.]